MNWQKASGYNKRSKVEAAMSRYKRVIGEILKSRDDARRETEVAIAVNLSIVCAISGKLLLPCCVNSPRRANARFAISMQQSLAQAWRNG